MSWKCPDCGKANESRECSCGYAYYKVLGTKPDDPPATVQQAVDYLLKIWKGKASKGDHISRQRATSRLKHIHEAMAVYKQLEPSRAAAGKAARPDKMVLISAAAGVILLVVVAAFFLTGREKPKEQAAPPPAAQTGQAAAPQPPSDPGQTAGQQPQDQAPVAVPPPPPDSSVERNEQWAIDEVMKSRVLDKFMTADEVAKKWAEKRPAWKSLGWQAKKMDGDFYLVSYLLSDGLNMDGMYFDISGATGIVRHLADHPDLQEKYGIRYKK